jgi:hypothetical protein
MGHLGELRGDPRDEGVLLRIADSITVLRGIVWVDFRS